MSNLQEHQAEQDALTAQCEAGTCGHAECNTPEPQTVQRQTITIYSVVFDGNNGTSIKSFADADERADYIKAELADDWAKVSGGEPMPEDWHFAWEAIAASHVSYWLSTDTNEVALPQVIETPDPIAAAYREEARATYADDEIQIDADAQVSIAENGAWVSAWVWVSC